MRQSDSRLLQLPEPCLLAVLHFCADDPRSLFRAARAHSKLHQAAVLAASSITASDRSQESVLLYLSQHGENVNSISFKKTYVSFITGKAGRQPVAALRQLPSAVSKLTSLELDGMSLQLQPCSSYQGVLKAASTALKKLRLSVCTLLDGSEGLADALSLLTGLEHLQIHPLSATRGRKRHVHIPLHVLLPKLQWLTYLDLKDVSLSR